MSTQIKINDRWWDFPAQGGPMCAPKELKVICGFPGIGKSHVTQGGGWTDSDSSQFTWTAPNVRNPEFPANYIAHIQNTPGPILASTHDTVLKALEEAKVSFMLCYPHPSCEEEYIRRYMSRGSTPQFIDLVRKNWMAWLNALAKNNAASWRLQLLPGEYLSDYVRNT